MNDQASKYEPLGQFLRGRKDDELPLGFRDVEEVLGFGLPPSARRHPAWWSNNRGTNVAVKAWRDAGWRTSRVDLGAERVVFVRETAAAEAAPLKADATDDIIIDRSQLRGGAIRLLEDYCEEKGGDPAEAIIDILNSMALERRRQLIERFKSESPRLSDDSVDLIREDRDAR